MSASDTIIDQRLILLQKSWKRRPQSLLPLVSKPRVEKSFAVAVSREAGAPGVEIAEEVGHELGWPVYDRQILEMISERVGLRTALLESLDEHSPNWLIKALGGFGHSVESRWGAFLHQLVQVLAALGEQGHSIIVGRGAAALLPPEKALRVRVVADLKDRVERSAQRFHLTPDEATERVRRVDAERRTFVREHFHKDVDDPHNFDVVVNASRLSAHECAALVVAAVRARREKDLRVEA